MEKLMIQQPEWCKVAEVELVYRSKIRASERPVIKSSKDCYNLLTHLWNMDKIDLLEESKVLFLNRSARVLCVFEVSSGGITGTVVDIRLVLAVALKTLATTLILSHNHPSGNLIPSLADEHLTLKLKEAAKLHDIVVADHLIITSESYLSFADKGLL